MTTYYHGSRGPVEIATMFYPHLKNARDKLVREQVGVERQAEIDAMSSRLADMEAEQAESAA